VGAGLEGTARAIGTAIASHIARFFRRAKAFVHELIVAGAMAVSGPSGLDDADIAEVDRQAAVQYAYFDRFHQEILANPPVELAEPSGLILVEPMTAREFAARVEQYGNSVWTAAQAIGLMVSIRAGAIEQRRVHVGEDTPCDMCQSQEAFGWLRVGDPKHLPIGKCTCRNSCHCHYEVRWPDGTIKKAGQKSRAA
jgi:hypothetical protein